MPDIRRTSIPVLGYMPVPDNFPYRRILQIGRPRHGRFSDFAIRHPSMPCSRRAKIFAPFDALAGFDERIENKETLYEPKRILSEEEQESLERKLSRLCRIILKRKRRKEPPPAVSVTCYVPCTDPENDACGSMGSYRTIRGRVTEIDPVITGTIRIDSTALPIADIADIEFSFRDSFCPGPH